MSSSAGSAWEKLLTYETLVHAIAGSAGSVTAMSVFYPLDTVRSRLQLDSASSAQAEAGGPACGSTLAVLRDIVEREGVDSLYRGLSPVLTSLCASGFVYFYTFHGLRAVFGERSGAQHSALKDLALGAVAGAVNVYLTTPLWVVNTRIKMQGISRRKQASAETSPDSGPVGKGHPEYTGIWDGLVRISRDEGIGRLWSGTTASLVLVSNPAIQFAVYEWLKRRALQLTQRSSLSSGAIFALGAVSKAVSTILTYPLQVVQTRTRYGTPDVKGKGVARILAEIARREGVFSGLYKGLEAKLLQTVLTTALMFLTYEKIAGTVFALLLRQEQRKGSCPRRA